MKISEKFIPTGNVPDVNKRRVSEMSLNGTRFEQKRIKGICTVFTRTDHSFSNNMGSGEQYLFIGLQKQEDMLIIQFIPTSKSVLYLCLKSVFKY